MVKSRVSLQLYSGEALLIGQQVSLLCHHVLLFLFAPLEVVLLLCSECTAKLGKDTIEGGDDATAGARREGAGCSRGAVRDTHHRNEEWLSRISNAPNQLAQWLKLGILDSLDTQIGSKEIGLVPIVHLQASEWALLMSLGVEIHPTHSIRHNHASCLC